MEDAARRICARQGRVARASGGTPWAPRGLIDDATWEPAVFVFFSSRLGCLGSILFSLVLTLVVLAVLGVF